VTQGPILHTGDISTNEIVIWTQKTSLLNIFYETISFAHILNRCNQIYIYIYIFFFKFLAAICRTVCYVFCMLPAIDREHFPNSMNRFLIKGLGVEVEGTYCVL
jgi:hypothetical protein